MNVCTFHRVVLKNALCGLALIVGWCTGIAHAQRQSALAAFQDFSSGNLGFHVAYQDTTGAINDYYWLVSSPGWRFARISAGSGYNVGQLIGYSDGKLNHVFGVKADAASNTAHIVEWYGQGVPTNYNDLTASAQTTEQFFEPPTGSVFSCYGATQYCLQDPTTLSGYAEFLYHNEHVFFRGETGGVKELYHSIVNAEQWHDRVLPGASAAGVDGEGLAASFDGQVEHVFYTGYNQHVD